MVFTTLNVLTDPHDSPKTQRSKPVQIALTSTLRMGYILRSAAKIQCYTATNLNKARDDQPLPTLAEQHADSAPMQSMRSITSMSRTVSTRLAKVLSGTGLVWTPISTVER